MTIAQHPAPLTTQDLTGQLILAGEWVTGAGKAVHGVDPTTGTRLLPAYTHGTPADVVRATAAAAEAFGPYRATSSEERAVPLDDRGQPRRGNRGPGGACRGRDRTPGGADHR